MRVRAVWFLAGACAIAAVLVLVRQRTTQATTSGFGRDTPPEAPGEAAPDWCGAAYEAIPGGGCLAVAPARDAVEPLIVYLHGRYARTTPAEEMDRQRRLAARATSRGFAVLVLRGRLGECSDPELADWYCWPSNERNADDARAVVDSWAHALATAHERCGARKPFLLGFSNGGHFSGLIAQRGLVDVEALVVAHGGPVEPVHALRGKPPLLLLSADDDSAQDDMIRYSNELVREQWPHDSYARFGSHGLTDEDIDAALAFFVRAKESLPLVPSLPLHRAIRHVRDASLQEEEGSPQSVEEVGDDTPSAIVTDDDGGGAAAE